MLRELGRRAHDLPVWETLACGLMTTVQAGSPDVQQSIVPRIVSGELQIAPALSEVGAAMPEIPSTVLADDAVTGTKIHVPVLDSALLLVSVADGRAVFVDPAGPGVEKIDETGSADRPVASYRLTDAPSRRRARAGLWRRPASTRDRPVRSSGPTDC